MQTTLESLVGIVLEPKLMRFCRQRARVHISPRTTVLSSFKPWELLMTVGLSYTNDGPLELMNCDCESFTPGRRVPGSEWEYHQILNSPEKG